MGMSVIPWAVMAGGSLLAGHYNPIAQPGEPGYTTMPQHHLTEEQLKAGVLLKKGKKSFKKLVLV